MSTKYATKEETGIVRERKAVVVERALDAILQRFGVIHLEVVVGEAKAPQHPLHAFFDWNDTRAAHRFRLVQARAMIQATKYIAHLHANETQEVIPVQVEVVRKLLPGYNGEGFRLRTDVLREDDTRAIFVERKLEVLRGWCRSVSDVPELDILRTNIQQLLNQVSLKQDLHQESEQLRKKK